LTLLRRGTQESCLSDGTLRSAVDNGVDRIPGAASHLGACASCRQRLEDLTRDAALVARQMRLLEVEDAQADISVARRKLRNRMVETGNRNSSVQGESLVSTMWKYRAARGALAMLALVLLTTAFVATPMRSLADDLLNRFRVEKFEAITIQMDQFGEFQADMMLRAFTSDHEQVLAAMEGLVEVESTFDQDNPENELVRLDDENAVIDAFGSFKIASNLPSGFNGEPQFMMSNGGSVTAIVDTASLNLIIQELRLPIYSIPEASEMPTMTFEADVPETLVTYYNSADGGHLAVVQMESPVLNTPAGLDMDALREEILMLPGLPTDFVAQLRSIEDWQQTLIIPVPEGAESRDVTIDGQAGLLIEAGEFDGNDWGFGFELESDASVVMWNDDGILYIVAGTVSDSDILDVAGSLR
jgi:hypothetical protein